MKKKVIAILLSVSMIIGIMPTLAFATSGETCGEVLSEGHTCPTDPVCICSVLCKADAPKNDCPVCCAEGGVCTGSDKYVTVQAMIDALRTEFKESEREAALAEYEAATKAIRELSEEEFALLDLTNYYAAANPTVIPEDPVVCKIGEDEFTSLSEAITAANNAGSATTIVLTSDITLSEKLTISGIVTIDGAGHTIIRGKTADNAWYTGNLITVASGAKLTLSRATIDGSNPFVLDRAKYESIKAGTLSFNNNKLSTYPVVIDDSLPVAQDYMIVVNGSLIMSTTTIQNHSGLRFKDDERLTRVDVFNFGAASSLTMSDSVIRNCATNDAGAVFNIEAKDVSVRMNSSTITNCLGVTTGSLIRMNTSGISFSMDDSSISGNYAMYDGNGVLYSASGCTVRLNNSSVMDNGLAYNAVDIRGNTSFTMVGNSKLSGDYCSLYIRDYNNENVTLENGVITDTQRAIRTNSKLTIGKDMTINGYVYALKDLTNNGTINGDVSVTGVLTNSGTINGNITLNIPAGADVKDYFFNTGSRNGELIVYYTTTEDYPYVLNLYYDGGTDQYGLNGSGHLKWGPNEEGTKNVTLADITSAVTVTKYGYTFAGWYYDEALTEKVTDPITLTAKTAEYLYAAWEKTKAEINYTAVTQNYGKQAAVSTSGGTVSGSETVDATVAAVNGSTITVNEGYTFAGWFTDEACTQKVTASWVGTDNKLTPQKNNEGLYESGSYYALFEEMTTTVTYKVAYTGTGSVCFENAAAAETITDTFGKVTGSPKTATAKPANGYMFVGWYTDEACTKLLSKQAAMNSSENGTFYAKFIKDHAIVTITKTVDKASSSDQSFILNISGTTYNNDPVNVDVVIVISAGQTSGCVKVVLPVSNGDYSISDQDGWNWRYKVKDNATITINGGDPDSVLDVTSTLENGKWFADSYIYPYKKES